MATHTRGDGFPGLSRNRTKATRVGGTKAFRHLLTVELLEDRRLLSVDYGDAPDTYATLDASGGARHTIVPTMYLGAGVDGDPDGQPTAGADGDDNDGNDDENGVAIPSTLVVEQNAPVGITVSQSGRFTLWADDDRNGVFEHPFDAYLRDVQVTAPGSNYSIALGPVAAHGTSYVRVRFSSTQDLPPDGPASDGEVEDYEVFIESYDYGDAPDPAYPTLKASGGARHAVVPGYALGFVVDGEPDARQNADATGDHQSGYQLGIPDEEGVNFDTPLIPGQQASVSVWVNGTAGGGAGLLNAWIDFNDDGTWGAGEQIFADQPVSPGNNVLSFTVPSWSVITDQTFARFRFSSLGSLGPTGDAPDGEVEDYRVEIREVLPDRIGAHRGNQFLLDANGNGIWEGVAGGDAAYQFGLPGDTPIIGDWNGDGYDEIGLHRNNSFYLDVDGSGGWTPGVDRAFQWGLAGDTPLVGDWDGDGDDEVGLHRNNAFYLDYDDSGGWTPGVDRAFQWGLAGDTPITGDWNGFGYDDVGLHRNNAFYLDVDSSGGWTPGLDRAFQWGLAGDTPLTGDWNSDGQDEVGLWRAGTFYLDVDGSEGWTPGVDRVHTYALSTDLPIIGAWREADKLGLHRNNTFYLDVNGSGGWTPGVDRAFQWGLAGDTPLVGDWGGDGKDEVGLHRNNTFYLDIDGSGGWTSGVDRAFNWGLAGDTPLVGDWDGDGKDEVGLHRGNAFYLDVDGSGGWTPGVDRAFQWGLAGDTPLVGDWDGDGQDEVGLHRNNAFYLDVDGSGGWTPGVDRAFQWGLAGDTPLSGDWNGDGYDELGIHRNNTFYLDVDGSSGGWTPGVDRAFSWGLAGDTPLVGNWAAAAPLMAAHGPARIESEADTLTAAAIAPLLNQAVKAYSALPLSAQQRVLLGRVAVRVDDLAGARLGEALGTTITLDINAAGYGWFIDPTPWDDAEFQIPHSDIRIPTSFDLLTAVMHELGHVLGYGHEEGGVMAENLPLGVRRSVNTEAFDSVWASLDY